jgi:dihydrofolate reductase
MGRVTYETLARYDDGTSPLSTMPTIMVSRSRTHASWGETTVVGSDEALTALTHEPGPPLRVMGSISLVQRLLRARTLDRLRLVVFPVVLGETGSEPVFARLPDLELELVATRVLDGRLVLLEYGGASRTRSERGPHPTEREPRRP